MALASGRLGRPASCCERRRRTRAGPPWVQPRRHAAPAAHGAGAAVLVLAAAIEVRRIVQPHSRMYAGACSHARAHACSHARDPACVAAPVHAITSTLGACLDWTVARGHGGKAFRMVHQKLHVRGCHPSSDSRSHVQHAALKICMLHMVQLCTTCVCAFMTRDSRQELGKLVGASCEGSPFNPSTARVLLCAAPLPPPPPARPPSHPARQAAAAQLGCLCAPVPVAPGS